MENTNDDKLAMVSWEKYFLKRRLNNKNLNNEIRKIYVKELENIEIRMKKIIKEL